MGSPATITTATILPATARGTDTVDITTMTTEATRGRVLGGKKPSGTEELDFASAPQGYTP